MATSGIGKKQRVFDPELHWLIGGERVVLGTNKGHLFIKGKDVHTVARDCLMALPVKERVSFALMVLLTRQLITVAAAVKIRNKAK